MPAEVRDAAILLVLAAELETSPVHISPGEITRDIWSVADRLAADRDTTDIAAELQTVASELQRCEDTRTWPAASRTIRHLVSRLRT